MYPLDQETVDYLLKTLINSVMMTLENGLAELLEEINIKDISVTEINNMDPAEIEKRFYSFAGKYFGTLEKYGWLGSLVGLLAGLISIMA